VALRWRRATEGDQHLSDLLRWLGASLPSSGMAVEMHSVDGYIYIYISYIYIYLIYIYICYVYIYILCMYVCIYIYIHISKPQKDGQVNLHDFDGPITLGQSFSQSTIAHGLRQACRQLTQPACPKSLSSNCAKVERNLDNWK